MLSTYLIIRNFSKLDSQGSLNSFGSLYEGMRIDSKSIVLYNVIYTVRRLLIGLNALFLGNTPSLQLMITLMSQTLILIYLLLVKPLDSSYMNNLEVFNEICILGCSYHLIFFTDYFPDPD